MKTGSNIILLLPMFFVLQLPAVSQETHYWAQQQGSISTLMGGASVASVRDNSSIFYNPGAMAFNENSSLSISANTYFINSLLINDGAGTNLDLSSIALDIIPSIIAGVIKDFEKPGITLSYAVLNTDYSFFDIALRNEMKTEILDDYPGEEIYLGGYRYSNRVRDDWIGLGSSKKLSDNVGIGFSMFATFRSQKYFTVTDNGIIIYDSTLMDYNTIGQSSFAEELNYLAAGLLWKIGLGIDLDKWNIGFSLTTPRVNLNFIGNTKIYRTAMVSMESISPTNPKIITTQEGLQTTYKSPWIFDLGLEYSFNKTAIATRMAYFTRIDAYDMVENTKVESYSNVFIPNTDFGVPKTAHRPVFNVAVGIEQELSEKIKLQAGFRTDFNYLDFDALDELLDFIPYLNYWDLYHFTGGVTWHLVKSDLTLGLGYTTGRSNDDLQQVNLSDPDLDRYLFGERQDVASARYYQLNAILGFIYFF